MGWNAGVLIMDWSKAYGPDGGLYPVQLGDVWECGAATMACIDLETPMRDEFYGGIKAKIDMAFTDPPWNAGNARSFRTKAGDGRPVDFGGLIGKVMSVLVKSEGLVWIEMGKQSRTLVGDMLTERGAAFQVFDMKYYNRHPCLLFRARFHGEKELTGFKQGLDETPITVAAIEADSKKGGTILDPCMGRGLIPEEALRRGRKFVGSELNARRMSVTLAKLHRLTGDRPQLVHQLGGQNG